MKYYSFNMPVAPEGTNQLTTIISFENTVVLCRLYFDTDKVSDTYNHWVCCMDIADNSVSLPERSFVLNPNCIYYADDDLFSIVARADVACITHDNLNKVALVIGVSSDE